jgi:hypothetical protein
MQLAASAVRARGPVETLRAFAVALGIIVCACDNSGPAAVRPIGPPAAAGASGAQPIAAAGSGGAPDAAPPPPSQPDAQVVVDAAMPDAMDAAPADAAIVDAALPVEDDDAGPYMPPDPTCVDSDWRLAPGFLVARRIEYIADRETAFLPTGMPMDPVVHSEFGTPCESAKDRETCLRAIRIPGGFGRHLITTVGDKVQLWGGDTARQVLGLIDTPAEAMWLAAAIGAYVLPCSVKVEEQEASFYLTGVLSGTCGPTPNQSHVPLRLLVNSDGSVVDFGPENSLDPICRTDQTF